jgi:hypothetical protein
MKMLIAKNKKAIFTPLLLLVTFIPLAFLFSKEQIQPVSAYQPKLIGTPALFIPWVTKNYPYQNTFGVSIDMLKTEYGLNVLAQAQPSWTRRDVNWTRATSRI